MWKFFRHMVDATWKRVYPCEELTFLGVTREGEILPDALLGLNRVICKVVIIALTQAKLEKKPIHTNTGCQARSPLSPTSAIGVVHRLIEHGLGVGVSFNIACLLRMTYEVCNARIRTISLRTDMLIILSIQSGAGRQHKISNNIMSGLRRVEPGGLPEMEGEPAQQQAHIKRIRFVKPRAKRN